MENLSFLERFADPQILQTMTIGEKLMGALIVTVLGMGVTFIVLSILWGAIAVMTRVFKQGQQPVKEKPAVAQTKVEAQPVVETVEEEDDEELIAVITAAVAASLQTSIHNIYVRNIVRVPDMTPVWGKTGRLDQMNSRF